MQRIKVIGLLIGLTLWSLVSHAATITVSTTNDNIGGNLSKCTLREAIKSANTDTAVDGCLAGSGADIIILPPTVFSLTLIGNDDTSDLGDLDVTQAVTIIGGGPLEEGVTTIYGNGSDRIFDIIPAASGVVQLSNLRLIGGRSDNGGSIRHTRGTLAVLNNTISDSVATMQGGAIYSLSPDGYISIVDSEISHSSAVGGGGLYLNLTAPSNITRSHILDNNSTSYGGGLYATGAVPLFIDKTTFHHNTATSNGGGISNETGLNLIITNSTLSQNSAARGGGVDSFGELNLANSTISGNVSRTHGGGLYLNNTTTIVHSTITLNHSDSDRDNMGDGGGLYRNLGNITLQNSIISGNIDDTMSTSSDCWGTISSSGYNILSNASGCTVTPAIGDQLGVPITLLALSDNGGLTQTHAIPATSPANNAIPLSSCSATISSDQRDIVRPQGSGCDIGAFELEPIASGTGGGSGGTGGGPGDGTGGGGGGSGVPVLVNFVSYDYGTYTLSNHTDVNATCSYQLDGSGAFQAMTDAGTNHNLRITFSSSGSHTVIVRCQPASDVTGRVEGRGPTPPLPINITLVGGGGSSGSSGTGGASGSGASSGSGGGGGSGGNGIIRNLNDPSANGGGCSCHLASEFQVRD